MTTTRTHLGKGTKENPKPLGKEFWAVECKRAAKLKKKIIGSLTPQQKLMHMITMTPFPWEDIDGLHTHVCGYDSEDHERAGCGHVFRHETHDAEDHGEEHFKQVHTCPNCGLGTWQYKLCPDEVFETVT